MDEHGLQRYDLQQRTRAWPLYQPPRQSLPGLPETLQERMARIDRQLEQERRGRELLAAWNAAQEGWEAVNEAYDNNPAVQEVLKLHAPVLDNNVAITCNECCGCDYYGDTVVPWPCGTYRVLQELL